MKQGSSPDLASVRTAFEKWRAQRQGKQRIPERLWKLAILLLDAHSFHKVSKELKLNGRQFKNRIAANTKITQRQVKPANSKQSSSQPKPEFLELAASDITGLMPLVKTPSLINDCEPTCRIIVERADGSRLSLQLPFQWQLIQSICQGFIKA